MSIFHLVPLETTNCCDHLVVILLTTNPSSGEIANHQLYTPQPSSGEIDNHKLYTSQPSGGEIVNHPSYTPQPSSGETPNISQLIGFLVFSCHDGCLTDLPVGLEICCEPKDCYVYQYILLTV